MKFLQLQVEPVYIRFVFTQHYRDFMKIYSWILVFLLSVITHSIKASECACEVTFRKGVYGSLSCGANWSKADWTGLLSTVALVDDIHDANALFKSWSPNGDSRKSAKVIGNLSLGYQLVNERLYLGGQIGYTLRHKQNFHFNQNRTFEQLSSGGFPPPSLVSGTSNIKSKVSLLGNEFNIDLKPGLLILKNLLLYARTGAAFTRMKIKNSGVWTEVNSENGLELQAAASSHHGRNKIAFRVGAGVEYLISEHLGICLDYIFTDYGKIKTKAEDQNSGLFDFNHVYGLSAPEVKVTTQVLMVGLVVHF